MRWQESRGSNRQPPGAVAAHRGLTRAPLPGPQHGDAASREHKGANNSPCHRGALQGRAIREAKNWPQMHDSKSLEQPERTNQGANKAGEENNFLHSPVPNRSSLPSHLAAPLDFISRSIHSASRTPVQCRRNREHCAPATACGWLVCGWAWTSRICLNMVFAWVSIRAWTRTQSASVRWRTPALYDPECARVTHPWPEDGDDDRLDAPEAPAARPRPIARRTRCCSLRATAPTRHRHRSSTGV